jgi:hypothetical protein
MCGRFSALALHCPLALPYIPNCDVLLLQQYSRFIIEIKIGRAEELFPLLQCLVGQGTRVRLGLVIECMHLRQEENRLMDLSSRCRCLSQNLTHKPWLTPGCTGRLCVFIFEVFWELVPHAGGKETCSVYRSQET